jgi:antitoxin component YwqK of YwqJK toxin-antitoxin module
VKNLVLIILIIFCNKVLIAQIDSIQSDTNKVYKEFKYKNGNISSKGYLENNKPTGFWKSYYITGVIKSEGKWKNNKLDSIWIFYDQIGDTLQKINYFQGKKNGYHFKYFKEENYKNIIASKELYINGKRNDKSLYYFNTGNIKMSVPYVDDKKQGIGFEYDINKNIISIIRYRNNEIIVEENINRYNKEGNKEGIWKEFYTNGILKTEKNYINGKLNGYSKIFNEEGKLLESIKYKNNEVDTKSNDFDINIEIKEEYDEQNNIKFQGSYNKNLPIGIHRFFNSKGLVIKSKTYNIKGELVAEGIVLKSGIETGDWIYYYENGKKKAQGKFINGKKNGEWKYFYNNGRIQQTGSYTGSKLSGIWKWYYETGELLKEEYFIYGQLDGEAAEYNKLGNIISKGNYIEGNKEGEWNYIIGDQKYIGKYVFNEKNGEWISYYIDKDKISFKGKFLQGKEDGKHEYYYPNGTLKEERYFEEGKKIKTWSKYKENGDLIIVVQFKDGKEYKINGIKVNSNNTDN